MFVELRKENDYTVVKFRTIFKPPYFNKGIKNRKSLFLLQHTLPVRVSESPSTKQSLASVKLSVVCVCVCVQACADFETSITPLNWNLNHHPWEKATPLRTLMLFYGHPGACLQNQIPTLLAHLSWTHTLYQVWGYILGKGRDPLLAFKALVQSCLNLGYKAIVQREREIPGCTSDLPTQNLLSGAGTLAFF